MSVYFTGEIGLDEALKNFREDALRKYPELDMSGIN
jgi:hypothetical protein